MRYGTRFGTPAVGGAARGPLLLAMALGVLGFATGRAGAQTAAELLETCRNEAAAAAERIAACTRAIGETGDEGVRAEAHLQRGVLYEFDGREEAAVEDYTAAIGLRPDNPLAWFNRGNALNQLDRLELALADYSKAIELDPKEPDFFNNRGQAHDAKGQHDLAIADYNEAIRLDGKSARPYYNRGVSFANKGDFRRAVADFGLAIEATPDDPDIYVARGAAWEVLGDTAAAKADFAKALEIDPDHEDAREGLSRNGG